MFSLKASEARANARSAFEEGRLQAQKGQDTKRCSYLGPCGIGVSLDEATARLFDSRAYCSIGSLIDDGYIKTDDEEFLVTLQWKHDRACISDNAHQLAELETFLRG